MILRECRLLGHAVHGIVFDDVADEERVRQPVRDVIHSAEFVRHGVAETEKRIGERHAGHRRGIEHAFAGDLVHRTVFVALGQILEDQPGRLVCQRVAIVALHAGDTRLQSMRQGVKAGDRRKPLRQLHHQLGIDDRHARRERIVRQREFLVRLLIRDHGERRHFRTGAAGGRNGDHHRFFAQLRQFHDAFADIHEAHGDILELDVRQLVHEPHDLGRVDRGSAADRDDHIGLEASELFEAALCRLDRRIRLDVAENARRNAHVDQLLEHGIEKPRAVKESVGDDEGAFLARKIAQRRAETAVFEVNSLRDTEPQHVFSPFRNGFDVQKVFRSDVFADIVPAPAAAPERQGGRQRKVVEVADTTLRARRIDQDAACQHDVAEFADAIFVLRVGVEDRGVSEPAVIEQRFCVLYGVFIGVRLVKRQRRRKLFARERDIRTDAFDFGDQDLGLGRDLDPREFGNRDRGLADDLRIELAVDLNDFADRRRFFLVQDIAAALAELGFDFVVNGRKCRDGLFRGADHAVVEGLGEKDRVHSHFHVAGVVHDHRDIARADADRGGAAGISGLHHAGTTGGEDQSDVLMAHQIAAHGDGRLVDPGDDVFRCARLDRGIQDDLCGIASAFSGARMRTEHDTVAGLQRDQRFEDRRGCRIRRRNDPGDHAAGLRDLDHAERIVRLDDPACLHRQEFVADVLGGVMILDDLVFHHAHAGFLDGHLRQRNPHVVGGQSGGLKDPVDLFLCVVCEDFLCGFDFGDDRVDQSLFPGDLFFRRDFRENLFFLIHHCWWVSWRMVVV